MSTTPVRTDSRDSRDSTSARYVPAGGGETVWLNGDIYAIKAGASGTGGRLAVVEATVPPGGGPPPHVHEYEDEAFYLLDGELDVRVGDEVIHARAGDFVFIPRRTVHGFHNAGLGVARQLLIFTPGGFEGFFTDAGRPAVPGVPIPAHDPADDDRIRQAAQRHGSPQVSVLP